MDVFEFLNHFKTKYMENQELQIELEEKLFKIESFEEWNKSLIEKSSKTREIYLENEELINEIKKYLKEDLDDDKAYAFYKVVLDMYEAECDDYPVMSLIIDRILSYYLKHKNYGKLAKLYHILAFEYYEAFGRTGEKCYIEQACEWYKKTVSYKEFYKDILDPDERIQIFIAYSNLVAPFGQIDGGTKNEIFDIYDEVLGFFYSPLVQSLDGNDEDFIRHINQIKEDIFFADEALENSSLEFKERFFKLVDEYDGDDAEGNYFRAKTTADLIRGNISPLDTAEKITSFIENLKLPNYKDDSEETLLLILNYHNNAIDLYDLIQDYLEKDGNQFVKRILKKVIKVHTSIPYSFYTQMMNNVCQEFYRDIHGVLKSFNEKMKLLLKLILVRQPTTYIHSMMVSEIALLIAKRLLPNKPELFIGACGTKCSDDVLSNQNKIFEYIKNAGLLHDVGKCYIVDIVNKQSRKLADCEFELIKKHPQLGLKMIDNDSDFKEYFDIMIGHHKWFNDNGGYPISFKKNESPYHFYIDLITISDCCDAATDILGRNYTKGKNFDSLFNEFDRDKGIKYNPEIVDFIKNDKELYESLKDFTEKGRAKIYYKAYQDILKED